MNIAASKGLQLMSVGRQTLRRSGDIIAIAAAIERATIGAHQLQPGVVETGDVRSQARRGERGRRPVIADENPVRRPVRR